MHPTAVETGSTNRNALALRPMREELTADSLPVTGELPAWLTGTLLRLTVADFNYGDKRVKHLFDGAAMVHKYGFAEGKVNYANRFLDTQAKRSRDQGKLTMAEFGTEPCRSRFQRFTHMFDPAFTDNANVNVSKLGERFLALTETPMPVEFDPATLDTVGVVDALPPGPGKPAHATAHPHLDRRTGAFVSYFARFGPRSRYEIHETFGDGADACSATMPVSRPSYMHSFALTERYAILQENPLRVNPLDLMLSGKPFIENYHWKGEEGALFHAFDRSTGERVGSWQADAFFCFHHINAFERGDEIVVDLVAHADAGIVSQLYLDAMESTEFAIGKTRLLRFRLRPGGAIETEDLAERLDAHLELPRINYRANNMRDYRYVYGTGLIPAAVDGDDPKLWKADVVGSEQISWSEPGCLPGEPVFVAAPDASAEDDGVVLSVVFDSLNDASYLLVLDAQSFSERARATVPHRVPLSFHGNFFAG